MPTLPSPSETLFVGDSKLFCGETLATLEGHELSYVTLLAKSFSLWAWAYEKFAAGRSTAPLLKEKRDNPANDDFHRWRGCSYDTAYEFDWDGSHYRVPVRMLVVESDALRKRKAPAVARRRDREHVTLSKLKTKLETQVYACRTDAESAAERARRTASEFHQLSVTVVQERKRRKRAKAGHPRKDDIPEHDTMWRITVEVERDEVKFESVLAEEICFVLVTNQTVVDEQKRPDADRELLRAYDDQDNVERCFRWTKHPLRVAPIFLKTPKRIAALGLVYVLALMVYALIQRDARARLARAQT